jgi:hypothetical protein
LTNSTLFFLGFEILKCEKIYEKEILGRYPIEGNEFENNRNARGCSRNYQSNRNGVGTRMLAAQDQ